MQIDLQDKITPHFTWSEALYLPRWSIHAFPHDEEIKNNIVNLCIKLEDIRDILKSPLKVTSFYRPLVYNEIIGGSKNSHHMHGRACDFVPTKVSVHKAKIVLKDFLDDLGIRMEDNGKGGWLHIDSGIAVSGRRFFKP